MLLFYEFYIPFLPVGGDPFEDIHPRRPSRTVDTGLLPGAGKDAPAGDVVNFPFLQGCVALVGKGFLCRVGSYPDIVGCKIAFIGRGRCEIQVQVSEPVVGT